MVINMTNPCKIQYQIVNKTRGNKGDTFDDKEAAEKELQRIKKLMKGQCSSQYSIQKIKC